MEAGPAHTYSRLPLSPEQDSEIRHYIHGRQRSGLPWDTAELHAMIADMLEPPEVDEEDRQSLSGSMDKESAAARLDGDTDREEARPPPAS
ncbi:hypothetical protein [Herbaspirillum sp. SJZ107]|uniref:hypothetical protein n=1 Tax=Herbaspirillum sp. SJZ107 TaxID=2572881 RepID=UPI0011529E3D|nr:hypothetical protein [Herbaspirillum sp. SJZ107]TQK08242.1 hypothetical protein FBX97_3555 [Herbaspirillum sp. SJZ107]